MSLSSTLCIKGIQRVFVNKNYESFCSSSKRDIRDQDVYEVKNMGQLKTYTSDLTDAEWERIEPLLPEDKPVGRLREVDLREILNAIFYRADNGIKWRNLPSDFPAWQTVYGYFRLWVRLERWEAINTALVGQVRQQEGREEEPSLGIIDSQSVRLGEKGGRKLALMATKR